MASILRKHRIISKEDGDKLLRHAKDSKEFKVEEYEDFAAIYKVLSDFPYIDHIATYFPEKDKLQYENSSTYSLLKDLIDGEDNYIEQYECWSNDEGKTNRISDYKAFAHIDENLEITADNLDEHALNQTCFVNYDYPKDKLIQELLNKLN